MKNLCAIFVWLLFAIVSCSAQTFHVVEILSKIAPTVRDRTSVPLRFPTHLAGLDDEGDLYAIMQSADDTGYVVVLGATPDCEGQHVGSYGALIGTTRHFQSVDFYGLSARKGTSVVLHHGIKGRFYDAVCGAYCSDSLIAWTEGKYHYIIGVKAEKKSNVIEAANSAIEAATPR
jgi:hypothetical protein